MLCVSIPYIGTWDPLKPWECLMGFGMGGGRVFQSLEGFGFRCSVSLGYRVPDVSILKL